MRYNDSEGYEDLKGLYVYIKGNPLSDKTFYNINKDVTVLKEDGKLNKSIGTAVKPIPIAVNSISSHAQQQMLKRNIVLDDAKSYIEKGVVMFKQTNGEIQAYYSYDGASVVILNDNILKTAFPSSCYDEGAKALMEVLHKHGK